jgi:hypothetical protein
MQPPAGWYPTEQGTRYWDGRGWTSHVAPSPSRPRASTWWGWGGLALTALLGAASSGVSGFFGLAGVYVLVVAVVALLRGRVGWAHLRSRAAAGVAVGAAFGLFTVGAATADPSPDAPVAASAPTATPSASATTASATPTPSPSPTPSLTPTPAPTEEAVTPATAAQGTALAAVASLTVKGRAPRTGYSRDRFGQAWFDTDRNGCDTRNDILRRDLQRRTMKNSCKVLAGTLLPDPYTGKDVRFVYGGASEVDIDHVVALGDAWQKGAATWAAGKRLAFANDPLNLLAVDAGANRAKGDGDAATWLPPNRSYRCTFVARQVAVKLKYRVWVTAAEQDAMVRVLSACPTMLLPGPGPAPTTAALPTTSAPKPATTTTAPKPPAPSTVYYENCTAVRAAGAAPLYRGQPGYASKLDRDGDGIACE